MSNRTPQEQLLFDLFGSAHEELCPHVYRVGKTGAGWTREHDTNSPHYGRFVDPDPDCRRPAHLKEPTHE